MVGKRVEKYGLIEVLTPAYVIWGLHNTPCWVDKVSAGYVFNSLDMVGSWHDVLALKRHRREGTLLAFRLLGDAVSATEVDKRNRRNKIEIKRVADDSDSWNRWLDYVDFGRRPR
jgi:hypothetical protein